MNRIIINFSIFNKFKNAIFFKRYMRTCTILPFDDTLNSTIEIIKRCEVIFF